MKKAFYVLSVFTLLSPVFATEEPAVFATAGYVNGAVDAVTSEYDATTNPNGRIVINGTGAVVSDVSVSNGQVTYTKTNRVTVPVDSAESSSRASIWIQ